MDAAAVGKKSRDAFAAILGRIPGYSAICQRARMLAAMRQFKNVTTLEAMRFLDVYDPRPRVHELRREGYWIRTTHAMQVTECGAAHTVGAYSLVDTDDAIAGPAGADGWVQMTLPWSQEPIAGAYLVQRDARWPLRRELVTSISICATGPQTLDTPLAAVRGGAIATGFTIDKIDYR